MKGAEGRTECRILCPLAFLRNCGGQKVLGSTQAFVQIYTMRNDMIQCTHSMEITLCHGDINASVTHTHYGYGG